MNGQTIELLMLLINERSFFWLQLLSVLVIVLCWNVYELCSLRFRLRWDVFECMIFMSLFIFFLLLRVGLRILIDILVRWLKYLFAAGSKRLREISGLDWVVIVCGSMISLGAILVVGIVVDRKCFLRESLGDVIV